MVASCPRATFYPARPYDLLYPARSFPAWRGPKIVWWMPPLRTRLRCRPGLRATVARASSARGKRPTRRKHMDMRNPLFLPSLAFALCAGAAPPTVYAAAGAAGIVNRVKINKPVRPVQSLGTPFVLFRSPDGLRAAAAARPHRPRQRPPFKTGTGQRTRTKVPRSQTCSRQSFRRPSRSRSSPALWLLADTSRS